MNDDELGRALQQLGMDSASYKALALLPLVQVAWADGSVQDAERDLILRIASDQYRLAGEGQRVLRNWLHHPPSASYARRGREVLLDLCDRAGFDDVSLDGVVALAKQVARSAGGFFGFGAIEATEAHAIEEIAQALQIGAARSWAHADDTTFVPEDADLESDGPAVRVAFYPPVVDVDSTPASLVLHDEDGGDQSCPVTEVGLTVGRGPSNAIQIEYDALVSRNHCRIYAHRDRYYAQDLRSVSGTWVDGERVVERRLFGGERIGIGSTSFFFLVR